MEDIEKLTQYGYKANANLVLNAEKRPRDLGPTGEVLALPEAVNPKELRKLMGVRAATTSAATDSDLRKRVEKRRSAAATGQVSSVMQSLRKASNVLDIDVSSSYEPKTQETKRVFSSLMAIVNQLMGGQSHAVVQSACEEILDIIKSKEGGSGQVGAALSGTKSEIGLLLNCSIDDDSFRQMLSLSGRVNDFQKIADAEDGMDEDLGVAVVFQDEENEGEVDGAESELDEVLDTESEPEEEGHGPTLVQKEHAKEVDINGHVDLMQDETSADIVNPKTIDAFWLQRQLSTFIADPIEAQAKAEQILSIFSQAMDVRAMENAVVRTIGFENFAFVKILLLNWQTILWCTRLARAKNDADRARIEDTMFAQPALRGLLQSLHVTRGTAAARGKDLERSLHKEAAALKKGTAGPEQAERASEWGTSLRPSTKILDLSSLTFQDAGHFMSNTQWVLPKNSWKKEHQGYQEIFVPAPKASKPPVSSLVQITSMPKWAQAAFGGSYKQLNPVQSRIYRHALLSAENLLLCAPTGAGKTNVAMLCVLREIGLHLHKESGQVELSAFKIVYVAPMKSLVREMVGTFSERLKSYGIIVRELSGDTTLSRDDIRDTQILVTTPEKWDIVTRKSGYTAIASLVKLIVIDEIHLLHDSRGPVLEAIISRTTREIEQTQEMTRIVGLSATLPNYDDVAEMLRVSKTGLFVFDHTFRPCPLQQIYIGVTAKRPFKQYQMMNDLCWERVREQAGKNQILVFVHSRKDTATTARFLRDKAQETDSLQHFVAPTSGSMAILLEESKSVLSPDLKDLIPTGFGIHHAGLSVGDRRLVEDLFAEGHMQVLVSTATLAWGVNLPAHSVIIKGTQVYSPELGKWTELSMLDVMQMLGRAGRPQFDTYGEGTILTTHKELKFYMSLLNEQLPVESQLLSRLPDSLNAEIVLGTVRNVREASQWLSYTYLYVRMKNAPHLYGLTEDDVAEDPTLEQRRLDLVHSAATILDRSGLVQYERKSGTLQSTELGRVASHYYLSYRSMSTFSEFLKPIMSDIDLLRVFSLSQEFRQIGVRDEEKIELAKLCDKVPIPVKQTLDEPSAKVNILLQAYISRLSMEGYALLADLVYVTQSAGRLMRALFEICLRRKWADNAVRALRLAQMVDHRMWAVETPLRQFSGKYRLPPDVLRKVEKTHLPWDAICDLEVHQIGELIRLPKLSKQVHRLIHMIPKLDASATFQPVTRTTLRVDLTLTGDFSYDADVHGSSLSFWILVEDQDEEQILHHEMFVLRGAFIQHPHTLSFTVPILEPMAPQYFIRILSDRWLGSATVLPLTFRDLILPDRFAPSTELLDLQPLPVSDLSDQRFIEMYEFRTFNAVQTQVFPCLFQTDQNVLIACPTGTGKTACAEFALCRWLQTSPSGRAVYMAPNTALVQATLSRWLERFGSFCRIGLLTGDLQSDLQIFTTSQIVVTDPTNFDALSRKWRSRPVLQNINLVIVDDCHFVGAAIGPVIEIVVSRIRFISKQLDRPIRVVTLGASVANASDLAHWCGVPPKCVFAFGTSVRPVPIQIAMRGIEFHGQEDRQQAMVRPAYTSFVHSFDEKLSHDPNSNPQIILFAPSRQHARRISAVIVAMASSESPTRTFLRGVDSDELEREYLTDVANIALRSSLARGVGFLHSGLRPEESGVVRSLFIAGGISVIVVAHDLLYDLGGLSADHIAVVGSQYYDGMEKKLAHYSIMTVEAMVGKCGRQGIDTRGFVEIFCHRSQSSFYSKFLLDSFPIESHLDQVVGEHLNAEIVNGTIRNVQEAVDYLTWTFLYRRLARNPNYYNLKGTSHRHLSDYLSELIENAIEDLFQSEMISLEEAEVSPLNLGMISAHYYLKYMTIEMFAQSLSGATRLKGILNLVSAATEFDTLPVRKFEEKQLQELAKHLRLAPPPSPGSSTPLYYDSHTKAHLLLQSHFSRLPLSGDVHNDLQTVLPESVRLIQAIVDVISSQGWLMPALQAMDVSQMIIQGVWVDQPGAQLLQLPHFNAEIVQRCVDANITTIDALVELEDDARNRLVQLDDNKMVDVANFCNKLPNLTVEVSPPKGSVPAGSRASLEISIERERDEEEEFVLEPVQASLYPQTRLEGWWLILGDVKQNKLIAIKKIVLGKVQNNVKFDFIAPSAGVHHLLLYAVCDSYVGADQQIDVVVEVAEPEKQTNSDSDAEMQTDQ